MDPCEEFARSFNEINTPLIGGRQKDLNHLVTVLKQINLSNQDLLRLEQLIKPSNDLEQKFKLIVFIQLKHVNFLFKIFESERLYLIGKLVKNKWFFRDAFLHVKGEELVNVLFEKVSPNTRVNIINKLAKHLQHEGVSEEYFISVLNKYGLNCAINLLPNCSVKFVRNVLEKYEVKFSDKQLLKIVKKDITFAEFYFQKFSVIKHYNINVSDYLSVLHYVVFVDFSLFISIFDKYELTIKLNGKLTEKVYAHKKNDVISRPEHYLTFMHYKTLVKLLGNDFKTFYANCFPKSIKDFQCTLNEPQKRYYPHTRTFKLIQYLPRQEKYEMITKTFMQVYKADIFKYPNFINIYLLDLMPHQERINWAKKQLKEDKWICYLDPKESIPMLKSKIALMSDRLSRNVYLNYLVETCRIHRDLNALLEVLKYFVDRHRNEDKYSFESFINVLRESFDWKKLSSQHWTELNKLLRILKLSDHSYIFYMDLLREYTHFYIASESMNDETIVKIFNDSIEHGCWTHIFQVFRNKRNKHYVLKVATLLPKQCKEEKLYTVSSAILTGIVDWNAHNKNDQIDFYAFPEIIRNVLDENNKKHRDHMFTSNILALLQTKSESEEKNLVRKEFFGDLSSYWYIAQPLILKYLNEEPQQILDHVDAIVDAAGYYSTKDFMQRLKFYSHLQIPQKFKRAYLDKLNTEEDKSKSIIALAHLMPTHEYIGTMNQYHVTNTKIDLDEENDTFKFRKNFIEALKFVDEFSLTVPVLKQFCAGDYLRHSLGTLYRVVDYTPVQKTQKLINELFDRAVSVRKHPIFLTVHTRDTKTIYECLKEMGQKEKNFSLLKFIFKRTFKYFCRNPTPEFWELFKTNSYRIKKDDNEAFDYLFKPDAVPYKYLTKYVEFAFERTQGNDSDYIDLQKLNMLKFITDENIKMISEGFCRMLLETDLFYNNNRQFYIVRFCCTYLTASDRNDNLEFVCSLLSKYVKEKWHTEDCGKNREAVNYFLTEICNSFRAKNNVQFLKQFASYWYKTVNILETYKQHLILQLTILFMTSESENKTRNFAEKVCDFYNENVQKFSVMIIPIFSQTLSHLISNFFSENDTKEENLFEFYANLIHGNKSSHNFALVLDLLPKEYSLRQDIATQHKALLLEISKCGEPWIQILYNNYFTNLEYAQ